MEILIELAILASVLCCMGVHAVLTFMVFRCLQERNVFVQAEETLTEEEQEARRLAAEAQAKYEQGFVNLMAYDGMPAKKKAGVL